MTDYCPNCGEEGSPALDCWKCAQTKCAACANPREVEHQHCDECRDGLTPDSSALCFTGNNAFLRHDWQQDGTCSRCAAKLPSLRTLLKKLTNP